MRFTEENITSLNTKEVFVFGSNTLGKHGAGAAKTALKWGAIYGCGSGFFGQTYAIPTKNEHIKTLPLYKIKQYVDDFIFFAKLLPDYTFLVTKIGTGLAGIPMEDIAFLFIKAINVANIILPKEFYTEIQNEIKKYIEKGE